MTGAWKSQSNFAQMSPDPAAIASFYRDHVIGGYYVNAHKGQTLARTTKPSWWRSNLDVELFKRSVKLRRPNSFRRRFAVFEAGRRVGIIQRDERKRRLRGPFTNKARTHDFFVRNNWPLLNDRKRRDPTRPHSCFLCRVDLGSRGSISAAWILCKG